MVLFSGAAGPGTQIDGTLPKGRVVIFALAEFGRIEQVASLA